MNAEPVILGIDTSNYTTSLALATPDGEVIASVKRPLPVKPGEVGLRQSDAVFFHTKNLPDAFSELSDALRGHRVAAVGVSEKPRDADGSYMPCFLSGVSAATAVSTAVGIPLYRFSHQAGHIRAAMYSAGTDSAIGEMIAFHVSGGTTEMLLCQREPACIRVKIIGETLDLNAGQAVDRVGVALGCAFPCGPSLEALAAAYESDHGRIGGFGVSVKGCDCHLSGLENMAARRYRDTGDKGETAAFTFEYIAKTLLRMTEAARDAYGALPLLYAGGVMSNRIIRERITERFPGAMFAEPRYSSDNAAGVCLLATEAYRMSVGM